MSEYKIIFKIETADNHKRQEAEYESFLQILFIIENYPCCQN